MGIRIILTAKIFLIWLYNSLLAPLPKIMQMTHDEHPPQMLFYILIILMFIPEFVMIGSREFRRWMQRGIEDDDGKFNKSDLKDLIVFYSSLWSLRVFLVFSWVKVFYTVNIEFYIYIIPLLGSFGIAGLPILKGIMKK